MFKKVQNNQSFPSIELEILKKWRKENTFSKSLTKNSKAKKSVFFDGPPFANGLPHYGHILISTLKDVMARYKTMRGLTVPRVAGWDCHGLPVEYEIEKELKLTGKKDIELMGVSKFNEACRNSVFRYTKEWEEVMERLGRWVDFEHGYATLNNDYMESIWWVFKQIWDKNMVFEDAKAMQICPRCETPLSNFEVSQGYKDVTDLSVTLKFKLVDQPDTYFLAWTTTPWSVASTMGLAVNKKIDYVKVKADSSFYILAEKKLDAVFANSGLQYEVVDRFKGDQIVGEKYQHVFDYYDHDPKVKASKNAFHTVATDYVSDEEGTGIVTINGAFGEEDMNAAKANDIPVFVNIGMDGCYLPEVKDFAGKFVKGQDQNIAEFLSAKGLLFKKENFRHSYPHCWRCDTPLLNYSTRSWFIKVTEIKDKLLKNNQKINWQPEHIKDGRFGKWLEGARDWSISRNRYWGCAIPIWRNENNDFICVGSMEELKKLTGGKLPKNEKGELDLHKPYIDEIQFMHPDHADSKDKKYLMKRIGDVFDCWFESGSMPYAQLHYPFENKKVFEDNFPADFIIEAIDQTRGWFYTLHVLSTILFDKPAFKNVIVSGHINAADGEKLSKRKRNFTDPSIMFAEKGADAMRFFLISSPVVLGEGVRFSDQAVDELIKKFILTIWNTYSFFVTYANIDGWTSKQLKEDFKPVHTLDKWILSEMSVLIKEITEEMENYNLLKASRPLVDFVDNLSNWYIRRSRRRFWKSENDADKADAYQTLYVVLTRLAKLIAPFMPFLGEEIYTNLTGNESVHLSDWPEFKKELFDKKLNQENAVARLVVALGHAARDKAKIKVRQPLALVRIALPDNIQPAVLKKQIVVIQEELNVKKVELIENIEGLVKVVIKPNPKLLGPKFGGDVQEIIKLAKAGDFRVEGKLVKVGGFTLEEGEFELGYESAPGIDAVSDQGLTVVLDTVIDQKLLFEGYAREIVRFVQELRKEADYEVNNRIVLNIQSEDSSIEKAVTENSDYIRAETLANELQQSGDLEWDKEKVLEIDFKKVKIALKKL